VEEKNFDLSFVSEPADLRIILAPLDSRRPEIAPGVVQLCETLGIPHDFLNERIQGVCHSFGTRTEPEDSGFSGGYAAWFRYVCKAVEPESTRQQKWYKSAFYLKKHRESRGGGITLVMFGPMPAVVRRIEAFLFSRALSDVFIEPLALFDLILDGLFSETDAAVWRLLDTISGLEEVSVSVASI
jgi:hypothetical protein